MKFLRAALMAGAACLATEAALAADAGITPVIKGPVAEVAIYHVADPENYPAMMAAVMEEVGEMPGLRNGVHMRSLKDPTLFADVNLWDSLEEAVAAAKQVETEDRFKPFMNSIKEIKLFGHFVPGQDGSALRKFLADGAVIEMAVYSVKDPAVQEGPRQSVYNALQKTDAFFGGLPLSPAHEGEPYIDFIAWSSEKEGMATAESMMAMDEHKAFFANAEKMSMFEFFEIYDMDGFE
ncbi:hypothetical protein [Aestuariispira insulae]|uniref:Quinol monooxygenase YgiN n=1 Tax=Aestuariispira insulae TaxID=1461337 RepID=A0A3D9HES8_9PROT|nr:hypothetical protein [Aestuariispira insulae]RED47989.1 hypothetical protein DFP90_1086 [Aestuariispira insulae]